MFNKVNINIPEPCHENWEAMSVKNKGKFCSSCKKTVFDFTKATDKEIIHHLSEEKNTCGRFLNTQLNRNLIYQNKKSSYWSVIFTSVISFIGIGTQNAISQTKQETIQTDKKNITFNDSIQNPNLAHKIKGVVFDQIGPLAGANIVIKGTTKGTVADYNGIFEIELENNSTLQFQYVGYNTYEQKIIFSEIEKNNFNLKIEMLEADLGNLSFGVVVGGAVKNRNFFGRQIHKIRNWFR